MEQAYDTRPEFAERFRRWLLAHRDRLAAWVRRNVVDYGPFGDEGHAVTRYELAREAEEAREAYKRDPCPLVDLDPVERAR